MIGVVILAKIERFLGYKAGDVLVWWLVCCGHHFWPSSLVFNGRHGVCGGCGMIALGVKDADIDRTGAGMI